MTEQAQKPLNPTTLTVTEYHARLADQGVSARRNVAFVCPVCGTVQSIASLILSGADPVSVERSVGFSCEGRFNNAGPWVSVKDNSPKAKARRRIRGCDWTLGGIFKIHTVEVILPDGSKQPAFEPATPEQAQQLERELCALISPQEDAP